MTGVPSLPDWGGKRDNITGNSDRIARFEKAAKALASCIIRNRGDGQDGGGIPVVVEGTRDERTLRALGFTGPIEKVNRGWDRPRLIAYLHSEYCSRPVSYTHLRAHETRGNLVCRLLKASNSI